MKKGNLVIAGLLFMIFSAAGTAYGQNRHFTKHRKRHRTTSVQMKNAWVDSVYQSLTQQERIGQLFMVAAYSGGENYNESQMMQLITAHQIGGLIFMQGTPARQAELTNEYQKTAQVPLLIGMDGEWGLGMRLTGVKDYPRQMLLGATRDERLVRQMGAEIAAQCKRLGVHIDFAPVVDVNNNPANPVINFRSFGQNKRWVARLGIAYMEGLQKNGIIACAKHFPGHGDVSVDSHKDLPVINKSLEEIDTLELYPFKKLIRSGVKAVMVAHLDVPALDTTPHLPTTLSKKVVTDLLQDQLHFKGLIFTDALNMKGVTKYFPNGETDLKAFLAGNDVLLFSQDVPLAIHMIDSVIQQGIISQSDLEIRVKKILNAKYEAGLNHFQPIDTNHIVADLNKNTTAFWRKAAVESATLVKDSNQLLQVMRRPGAKIAYWDIRSSADTASMASLLQQQFHKITAINDTDSLNAFDAVVVSIGDLDMYPGRSGSYGLSDEQLTAINELSRRKNVLFIVFGNAYLMKYLCSAGSVLVAYEDNPFTEQAAVSVLSGKVFPKGKLPVISCQ